VSIYLKHVKFSIIQCKWLFFFYLMNYSITLKKINKRIIKMCLMHNYIFCVRNGYFFKLSAIFCIIYCYHKTWVYFRQPIEPILSLQFKWKLINFWMLRKEKKMFMLNLTRGFHYINPFKSSFLFFNNLLCSSEWVNLQII
jgi:hypothetical protein